MLRFLKMLAVIKVAFVFMIAASMAEIPGQISFQGILKYSSGDIVTDSTYSVTFTIYDNPTGTNIWWQEEQPVITQGGYFTVLLGSVNPIPDSAFQGAERR